MFLISNSSQLNRSSNSQWPGGQNVVLVVLLALLAGCGGGSMASGSPAVSLSTNSLTFPDETPRAAQRPAHKKAHKTLDLE
jgi:hypothetical protein